MPRLVEQSESETSMPRWLAGTSSAVKTGATTSAKPTPTPCSTRPRKSSQKPCAAAIASEPTRKKAFARQMAILRPYRSAARPAMRPPAAAAMFTTPIESSSSTLPSPSAGCICAWGRVGWEYSSEGCGVAL